MEYNSTDGMIGVLLVGLAIGSFLNVLILRIDELKTIFKTRSHCPKCRKTIAWYDLIPLVSFTLLKAKCRNCSQPISWQYPLVEAGTALVWVALYQQYGINWSLLLYAMIFSMLIVVFVHDLKTQLVPEEFVWAALIVSIVASLLYAPFNAERMLIGGAIGGGILAIPVLISKEKWMGYGDIKIGAIVGVLTGFPAVIASMFASFIAGSIVGVVLIALKIKSRKDALPFAPFLIGGALFGLLYGQRVVDWYLSSFII